MALDREEIKRRLREKAAQRMSTNTPPNNGSDIDSMTDEVMNDLFDTDSDSSLNNNHAEDNYDDFDVDIDVSFEEETPPTRQSYTTEKGSSVPVFNNIRPEQKRNMYSITPKACTIPKASNFFTKHKRKMIESHTGMSYMYKESFNYLLDCGINSLIGMQSITTVRDIRKVALEDGIIKLHAFEIDPINVLDPALGNTLYDLIEFKTLFKKFPMLQHLRLDTQASELLTLKYGDEPSQLFNNIFIKECKNLQILEMVVGNKTRKLTRNNFNSNEAKSALAESRMRSELDQVSSALNPKKDRMTKAEKHRVNVRDKAMHKFNWGPAKELGIRTAKNLGTIGVYGLFGFAILTGNFIAAGALGALAKSIHEMRVEGKNKK